MKAALTYSLLTVALTAIAPVHAQDAYPNRAVTIVVPYPPGGATDILARQLSAELAPRLGQPVVVENRAGASGVIGFDHVARAKPDGYTLLMGTANMTIVAAFGKAPFNPVSSFAPISTLVSSQNMLTVRPGVPAKNLKELIDYAKANPGKLNYGSSGIGTPLMSLELLKSMAKIDMTNIPYKGDAPAIVDLLGGQIDMYATTVTGLIDHVRNNRLRALGVTGKTRAGSLPDVPTIAEAGVPGYELTSWYGILAPAGTPEQAVETLNKAIVEIIAMPDMQSKILAGGSDPSSSTPQAFQEIIRRDVAKYTKLVKDLNLNTN